MSRLQKISEREELKWRGSDGTEYSHIEYAIGCDYLAHSFDFHDSKGVKKSIRYIYDAMESILYRYGEKAMVDGREFIVKYKGLDNYILSESILSTLFGLGLVVNLGGKTYTLTDLGKDFMDDVREHMSVDDEKLTPDIVEKTMRKLPSVCDDDDLKSVFRAAGFRLKEYASSSNFEIHHMDKYIIHYSGDCNSKLATFSNENVDFGGVDGISMTIGSVKELLSVVLTVFMNKMRIHYEGATPYDEEEEHYNYTPEEYKCIIEKISNILTEDEKN